MVYLVSTVWNKTVMRIVAMVVGAMVGVVVRV